MKYKDWLNQKDRVSPVKGKRIYCPCCGYLVGYEADFMFLVIPEPGIVCPQCDEIVIWSNQVIFSTGDPRPESREPYMGDPLTGQEPKIICDTIITNSLEILKK